KALARLTQKHLKYVDFDDCNDLPADYYKFFKNECSFDDSRLDLCCVKKPTLSQFFELTSTDRSIITHFEKFFRRMPSTKRIFPAVQSLSFHPCFCEEDFEDFPFVFTTAAVKDFSNLLVESMPNLTNVVANFSAQPEQRMFSWKRVYNEMKKFTPEMFEHIPSKVKGSLNFYVVDNHESLKKASSLNQIIKLIPKTNPGVDFDHIHKRLVKKFDIHDGLTFDFTLQLSEEESEDEYSSENESDEMEE
uniref:DUF38 domain-containing protein n=1 Tax=Panagrolaimus sp. ES5 TaxID=591445 RepID=A0AC34FX29_9BILA